MDRFWRKGALALGLVVSAYTVTACPALQSVTGEIKGTISGKVVDPDNNGLKDATVQVYTNKEISDVINSDGVVDLEKLAAKASARKTQTDTSGAFKFADLKVLEGPYVIVAANSRGKDYRGVDRDSKKLFELNLKPGEAIPEFKTEKILFPDPTKEVTIDFQLPNDTPPAPPTTSEAAPTPEPVATPAPAATPTPTPKPADSVLDQSQLSKPKQAAVVFGTFAAAKLGSGIDPAATTEDGSDGFKVYKLSGTDLADTAKSNKILLTASVTSGTITEGVLKISRIKPGSTDKGVVAETKVKFSGGKLVSDNSGGYVFAIPRDKAKYVLQLKDSASGALSNAIALDASALDESKIRPFTVILTWDKGDGTDVDLHVYDTVARKEAWFGNFTISAGSLDLDNTEGYGPETFTGGKTTYAVSVNYWYGTSPVGYKVRVITKDDDKTYTGTLQSIGKWKDIGKFEIK
ncbi:MAG: hypothetical protein FJZ01_18910 [Candidatus Sericytochromatia bacterium]|nr:hypothetical protein [Candidatus Tanganyikabacteria bacterium]